MRMIAQFEVKSPKKMGQLSEYLAEVSKHMALVEYQGLMEVKDDQPQVVSEVGQEGDRGEDRGGLDADDGKDDRLAGAAGTESVEKPKRGNSKKGTSGTVQRKK